MRDAVLTVSPNRQYLGIFRPTTPAHTGPARGKVNTLLLAANQTLLQMRLTKSDKVQSGSGLCVRTAVQRPGWETVRVSATAAAAGSCRRLEIKGLAPCLRSLTALTLVEFGLDWWEVTNHSRWLISSPTLKGKHILG